MEISLDNIYSAFCNLDERTDRLPLMLEEVKKLGILTERQRSYPWKELWDGDEKYKHYGNYIINIRGTKGALGCWFSQIEVMKNALKQGKHALILEDDVVICDDMQDRFPIIFDFLNKIPNWDCFWLGGHYHKNEVIWHKSINGIHTHHELPQCNCTLNKDWEPTDNPQINRTFAAFSTMAYIVNHDKIQEHIDLMLEQMNFSMGIDWWYILNQPKMITYAFNPGCARQYSSMSSIGNGYSNQDFSGLGEHWFQKTMVY